LFFVPSYLDIQTMPEIAERITVNLAQYGGCPCIRGMCIRVSDVLDVLENGLSTQQILEELPDLEESDIMACLYFAKQNMNHPIISG